MIRPYESARTPDNPATLRWPKKGECSTCGTWFARFIPNTPTQSIKIHPTVFTLIYCDAPPVTSNKHCPECGVLLLEDPWRKLVGNEA